LTQFTFSLYILFYSLKDLDEGARGRLVENICGSLSQGLPRIQKLMVEHFTQVNATFGQRLQAAIGQN
jgi:catalase